MNKTVTVGIGDEFVFFDGSPWPPKIRVRVIDVRDGWVRYTNTATQTDDRMKTDAFLSMYRQ